MCSPNSCSATLVFGRSLVTLLQTARTPKDSCDWSVLTMTKQVAKLRVPSPTGNFKETKIVSLHSYSSFITSAQLLWAPSVLMNYAYCFLQCNGPPVEWVTCKMLSQLIQRSKTGRRKAQFTWHTGNSKSQYVSYHCICSMVRTCVWLLGAPSEFNIYKTWHRNEVWQDW